MFVMLRSSNSYPSVFPFMMNRLKVCHINARSVSANIDKLRMEFMDMSHHIIGVSESNLKTSHTYKSVEVDGYKLFRNDRVGRRGGGVAFYVRSDFSNYYHVKMLSKGSSETLEYLTIQFVINSLRIVVCAAYMHVRDLPLNELSELLSALIEDYDIVILVGDLNINFLDMAESRDLRGIFESLNLYTTQTQPTRVCDTTERLLDYIVSNVPLVTSNFNQSPFTDHDLISVDFNIPVQVIEEIKFVRDYGKVDIPSLHSDILNVDWTELSRIDTIDGKLEFLYDNISIWLSQYAPFKMVKQKYKPIPWFSYAIKNKKQLVDVAKNVWKRSRCEQDKRIYKSYEKEFNKMVRAAKRNYLRNNLDPKLGTKILWRNLEKHGFKTNDPAEIVSKFSPNELNEEFVKVPIFNSVQHSGIEISVNDSNCFHFTIISDDDVLKAICSISSNAMGADNLPLKFLKIIAPVIVPHLTYLFNKIVEHKYYPKIWKVSKVIGLPKIKEPVSPSDVRPIAQLSVLSKVFERVISDQMKQYLNTSNLLTSLQSGFRERHSTATVLVDVSDYVRNCLDNGNYVLLCLLDFSKAFNCISFDKFVTKLRNRFNFSSNASELMLSYLTDRFQFVEINGVKSSYLPLPTGVPQGSIMGPLIFAMYINDIGSSIRHSKFHLFADDLQIFCEIASDKCDRVSAINDVISNMNSDIENVIAWSAENQLLLNSKKSKVIMFSQMRNPFTEDMTSARVRVGNDIIRFSETVKNLGVTLDKHLNWNAHVNSIMQKMYCGLRMLWRNSAFTPIKVRMLLARSLILSNLFYCDVVFSELSSFLFAKIKRVYNSCLRYIFGLRRRDRLTPYYNRIFGCSLSNYFDLRILVLLYKIITTHQPKYLYDKLVFAQSVRTQNLILPNARTNYMKGSFMGRSARLWNTIPANIKCLTRLDRFRVECVEYLNNQ